MTNSNTMTPAMLADKIDALFNEREAWETGSYAKSTQELTALLEKCLAFYSEVKASRLLLKKLNVLLDERGLTYNTATSSFTKIVRLVFGDCGKRAYTYARVLDIAHKEKPENQSLASFLVDKGGIDQLRRTASGLSPAAQKAARIAAGEVYSMQKSPIFSFEKAQEIFPSVNAEAEFCLALVRRNADGTSSIVHAITNATLINEALAIAGRDAAAAGQAPAAVNVESQVQAQRLGMSDALATDMAA